MKALVLFLCILIIAVSQLANASAWIGTQDKQLHYDVQTLSEWGYIDSAVTTYPIPWKGVAQQISSLNAQAMAPMPAQALARLRYYLNQQKQLNMRHFVTLQGATDDVRFRSLDDGVEETAELNITSEFYHNRWSGQLNVSYASKGQLNLDNSFLAYQFGDWNLRVGSLDQFWGPGQSSSLILSNNTRPLKSVALSRSLTTESEHPWLSWMGPWYFTTQLGQMDSERVIPDTKLLLTRFTARPLKGLEIGASWAAMWGGEGQEESLNAFWEVITFQTVCLRAAGCNDEQLTTRGNHLAGFDIKYTFQLLSRPVSVYAQRIGEDAKDGYRVTDNANLLGISTYIANAKVFIETSDTQVACQGDGSTITNCYYENGTYQTGYRMYERSLGSTFDSDAKQITLGANLRFDDGAIAEIYIRSAELNPDGQRPSPVLTDDVSEDVLELSGFYQRPLGDWLLRAGGSVANRDYVTRDDEVDALLYLKAQYAF
ncbi:capsule assembly Wzi family protein [Glaciecola siphonariae]|uniref:Capsule assembly Wzi family protein n=1 Tax=Glaciecola siphonariae TaxID=521012 RepID=A0ABV9LXX3_9ALTE